MPTLGITGGIASGKSTFCALLKDRAQNAFYFDADACSRELLDNDLGVKEQVLSLVHPLAYREGRPDRAFLRELVYHDAARKQALEEILHPRIRARWVRQAEESRASSRLFVVDIPLLFETKAESHFDRIVTVACSRQTQIDRLATRRSLDPATSARIIAAQFPLKSKLAGSHHVIWNDGSLETLTAQTDLFSSYLHARYG